MDAQEKLSTVILNLEFKSEEDKNRLVSAVESLYDDFERKLEQAFNGARETTGEALFRLYSAHALEGVIANRKSLDMAGGSKSAYLESCEEAWRYASAMMQLHELAQQKREEQRKKVEIPSKYDL